MPGIAGIVGTLRDPGQREAVAAMAAAMVHERFHHEGELVREDLGAWLGWACQAGSFAGTQPVWNETGDLALIFHGEEYRDPAELRRLRAGNPERPDYLLRLYETEGPEFVAGLNGWFAGVLLDLRRQEILLFNDRYGLGRIYLHETDGACYFASEAKALLKVLPQLRALDVESLSDLFAMGCVLGEKTLFHGISLLPPGSLWTFRPDGSLSKSTYFEPGDWERQPTLPAEAFYEALKARFSRLLPRYARGPGALGLSLTGGLDGRLLLAWWGAEPGTLPCYTFGGTLRDCADARIARELAALGGQSHATLEVGAGFLQRFPVLAEKAVWVSDGTMDVSGAVELYVNRLARQIAPVRVTGSYGSEILRRSVAFKPGSSAAGILDPGFRSRVAAAGGRYDRARACHPLSFIAFRQVPWHHYARFSLEHSQLSLRLPYLDNDLVSLMYQAPPELAASPRLAFRLVADGFPELAGLPTDRGLSHGAPALVESGRRAFQALTFKAEYAFDLGMPHWLARANHRLAFLEPERLVLGRHKFYHFRRWYAGELAPYVKDLLLDARTLERPWFDRKGLEQAVIGHTEGRANHTADIHRALTTELTVRSLIEAA